jgi:hypothetical protein
VPKRLPKRQGSLFKVAVRLDTKPFTTGESGQSLEIEAPPEIKRIKLGVLLTTTPHFTVVGQPFLTMTLQRDRKTTDPVVFTLSVTDAGAKGDAGISAQFVYQGRICGRVDRAWIWRKRAHEAELATGRGRPAGRAVTHLGSRRPDLTVLITGPGKMAPGGDLSPYYQASVITTRIEGWATPRPEMWPLPGDANRFIRDRIAEFESPLKTPEERQQALDAAGPVLWDAAPDAFKKVLEKLVKARRKPRNIYIASDEPSLPWELMIPSWQDDRGVAVDREPLGVEFPIARWSKDDAQPPPPRIVVRNSFVIAPVYDDDDKQLDATKETEFLEKELSGRRLDDASRAGLNSFLSKNFASLLHFVCHGEVENDDDVIVLDGKQKLSSREARRLKGLRDLCAKERPLVFLNACEAGAMSRALLGGAGFPKAFGEIGAVAIVAPLWSVEDVDASEIGVRIYRSALRKSRTPTIAKVVRDLRAMAYAEKNPRYSYAAYVFYGDPWAKLERT